MDARARVVRIVQARAIRPGTKGDRQWGGQGESTVCSGGPVVVIDKLGGFKEQYLTRGY